MPKFTKRPVVIEAVQAQHLLIQAAQAWHDLPIWIREAYEEGNIVFGAYTINIQTLEGRMVAEKTDWVIRGVRGEIYPCKPDIFAMTYDPV